jgi:hypothetical protein
VNHLNFLLTALDENRAEPPRSGRASGFSSIRTILRRYKFPAYATQQVSCNTFHQSTAIITTTGLTGSKEMSLSKLYMCESCSDELYVLMKSLLLTVAGSVPRQSNQVVPDRNSFPQPQISVGTFHFLEKRVQYRISTKFK